VVLLLGLVLDGLSAFLLALWSGISSTMPYRNCHQEVAVEEVALGVVHGRVVVPGVAEARVLLLEAVLVDSAAEVLAAGEQAHRGNDE
jgi:hypothetical protein